MTKEDSLEALADFIDRHAGLAVLSGAGMSTGSGIPGYRDKDGTRRGRAPVQGPEFRESAAVRRRYWARSMLGWPLLAKAEPNDGHRALARLEQAGRIAAVITQNVDGLHQRAGSMNVVELHGSIRFARCLACGRRIARAGLQSWLEQANPHLAAGTAAPAPDGDAHIEPDRLDDFRIPQCAACGGVLMPDVVFFGDGVPRQRTEEALRIVDSAPALLVVGSSLMVHSGYRFCTRAADAGKPVAAINIGKTRADHLLSFKIELPSEDALPRTERLLRTDG